MSDPIDTASHEAPVEAVEPTPTIPVVAAPPAPRSGRSKLRWLVALVITVLVAGTAGAATLLLTASAGDAAVLAYVPADTVSYMELRLDLPGSQHAEVAKLLSAFPGFADQAALNAKLGEAFDRLVKAATKDTHDYQTEIAPWFSGEVALATGPAPASAAANPSDGIAPTFALASARVLVLVGVTDTAKSTAWLGGILTATGATTSSDTYNGTAITIVHGQDLSSSPAKAPELGFAVMGKVLAIGDTTSLKAAIDTKGATGLGSTASFRQAESAVAGDRVGFVWTDLKASLASSLAAIKAMDTSGTASAALDVLGGMVPAWSAGAIRAADGDLVIDAVQPHVAFRSSSATGSDIAALAPKGTIALLGTGDLGTALTTLHDKLAAEPKLAASFRQVDSVLGLVGGFSGAVGWIGNAGVAVTAEGTSLDGGVIIAPSDAAAAKRLFGQLRSFIEIGTAGSGPAVADETYKDATITTVNLSSLAPLLSSMGSGSGMTPSLDSVGSNLKLVYAVTDKVVVLGVDAGFVKAVLDARTGDSLANDARFAALAKRAGVGTAGVSWLDISAIRGLAEGTMPAADRSKYETDVKPYLVPLDALVSGGTIGSDLDHSSMILSVNH